MRCKTDNGLTLVKLKACARDATHSPTFLSLRYATHSRDYGLHRANVSTFVIAT